MMDAPALRKVPKLKQLLVDALGILLIALIALIGWTMVQQFSFYSVVPLGLLGYAAFSVMFELTVNRGNVPALASGFTSRSKISALLRDHVMRGHHDHVTIVDFGSGRGQLTRHIARSFENADVLGIELARLPFLQSRFLQKLIGLKNLSYRCSNFWDYDCSRVDAVVFYLTPNLAHQLGEKLFRELEPGAVVVSHTFPLLGQWTPAHILEFRTPFKEIIYLYKKA